MGSIPIVSTVSERIVVVGASLAGLRACETLRTEGHLGEIVVVSDDDDVFYDRPPLSKKFLAGEWDRDRVALRKQEAITSLGLEVRSGVRAIGLDLAGRRVSTSTGPTLEFDGLIIASGARPRSLSLELPANGVHQLRTLTDAERLRTHLLRRSPAAQRVVVVGAGFIGLEVAATARRLGADVVVLEGAPAPLIRALGPTVGQSIADIHRRVGTRVSCGVVLESINGGEDVRSVTVDGEEIAADLVVIGIGASPCTEWLEGSSLTIRDGVVCDAMLRAAPRVFAAGDVVRWPNTLFSDLEPTMRIEHWTNAAEQGAAAARNLLAEMRGETGQPYVAVPFFWSDQLESKIQFLGRSVDGAQVDVVAGSLEEGRFCALYSKDETVCGVLGVSMPALVMPARPLVESRTSRGQALRHFAEAVGRMSA